MEITPLHLNLGDKSETLSQKKPPKNKKTKLPGRVKLRLKKKKICWKPDVTGCAVSEPFTCLAGVCVCVCVCVCVRFTFTEPTSQTLS